MVRIPYGHTHLQCEEGSASVLYSRVGELRSDTDGSTLVRIAMEHPIDSPSLSELAKGKQNCVIIISDHTRPVPSRDILPHMIRELREGNPEIEITFLVATGCHRPATPAELEAKLGKDLMAAGRIVMHDCTSKEGNVSIGTLPSGTDCVIDRVAAEADLLVAEGFIEPHFFAGFSGGRKSVLPGICDRITVFGNHCSKFIDSPFARTGILDGNPLHEDMLAAAKLAKLAYIVNVIIDEEKKTVAAFAGNFETAHRKGCDFLLRYCRVSPACADIVLTSNGGAPLDQNLYQCVKGMTTAEATCNPGGTIILCAACADGHGGEGFYRDLKTCESPAALYASQMATPQEQTPQDQWQSQVLARILMKHRVIVVTRPELRSIVEDMKMQWAATPEDAIAMARALGGKTMTVIPDGISVVIA